MRVVSLLPAATEIVAALGDLQLLVGISHECDFPPEVRKLPRVTTTPVEVDAPSGIINAEVIRLRSSGKPVIGVDAEQLRSLAPDLIITQDLCEVCAVGDGEVHRLAAALSPPPRVLSLRARDLAGIWSDIQVGSPEIPRHAIVPGCGGLRRFVAAPRAALGDSRSDGKPP